MIILSPKCGHFNGRDRGFGPLIAMLAPTAVNSLLYGVVRKYTKYYWNIDQKVEFHYTLGSGGAYKIEMFGLSLYNAAYGHYGIHLLGSYHLFTSKRQFKAAGDVPPQNISFGNTTIQKSIDRTLVKILRDF